MHVARALRSLAGLHLGDGFGERFFVRGPEAATLALVADRALPSPPWTWTDDTAQAHVLTDHLLEFGEVRQDELAMALARRFWSDPGRGYGAGARDLLGAIAIGDDWRTVARASFGGLGSMGNGAAMRVAPLGAFFSDDLDRTATEAARSAEVSHANINGIAGAVAVAVATACVARGAPDETVWLEVLERTPESHTRDCVALAAALALDVDVRTAADALGTGARVCAYDTVPFCLWSALAARGRSFEDALWRTVEGLGDRDTTCAIVGGILAAADHVELPEPWVASLEPLPTRA